MFLFYIKNNNIVLYLQGWYRVGGMLRGEHYESLVLFVVYFVLKMFKNIDFYIKARSRRGVRVFFSSEQESIHVM